MNFVRVGLRKYKVFELLITIVFMALPINAFSVPPAVKYELGGLISLNSANSYYGSSITHTDGLGLNYVPQEIVDLARSLGANRLTNSEFIENVYFFVKYNVEAEFRYGLSKGGFGALVDQSGTPFDQVDLMVKLLHQGGISAKYQLGNLTLNAEEFGKWTGHVYSLNEDNQTFNVSADSVCSMLANGGIPALINGTTKTNCAYSTSFNSVTMRHIWVVVADKRFDPSYVQHDFNSKVDLSAAAGCGTDVVSTCGAEAKSAALLSATESTFNGLSYIKNINENQLGIKLKQFGVSLQTSIQASYKNLPLRHVIGGKKIKDPKFNEPIPSDPGQYTSVGALFNGGIPNQYRTKLSIIYNSHTELFYADEINNGYLRYMSAGYLTAFGSNGGTIQRKQRLVFEYVKSSTGATSLERHIVHETQLPLNDIPDVIFININHPYAWDSGLYADETLEQILPPEGGYTSGSVTVDPASNKKLRRYFTVTLHNAYGRIGGGRRKFVEKYLLHAQSAFHDAYTVGSNGVIDHNAVPLGLHQVVSCGQKHTPSDVVVAGPNCAILGTAVDWLAQYSLASQLIDGVMQTTTVHHHSIGGLLNYEDEQAYGVPPCTPNPDPLISSNCEAARWVGDPLIQMNVVSTLAVSSREYFNSGNSQNISVASMLGANFMSMLEDGAMRQAEDTFVTASTFGLFKESNEKNMRFYKAQSGQINSLQNVTNNFVPNVWDRVAEFLNFPASSIAEEYTVIIPEDGVVGNITPLLTYGSNGFFAFRNDGTHSSYISGNGDKGTSAADETLSLKDAKAQLEELKPRDPVDFFNINPVSGELNLTLPSATIGYGEFPRKISVALKFDQKGKLQNFRNNASIQNNGAQGLGEDSALDASAILASVITLRDLYESRSGFAEELIGVFVGSWAQEQLMHNVVNINIGGNQNKFVRLPDSITFNPPNLSLMTLTKIGNEPWEMWGSISYGYHFQGIGYRLKNPDDYEWYFGDMNNSAMTVGGDPTVWKTAAANPNSTSNQLIALININNYKSLPTNGRDLRLRLWKNANGEQVNYYSYESKLDETGTDRFSSQQCPDGPNPTQLGELKYLDSYVISNYERGYYVCYGVIWGIVPGSIPSKLPGISVYNAETSNVMISQEGGLFAGLFGSKYFLADGTYIRFTKWPFVTGNIVEIGREGISPTSDQVGRLKYNIFDRVTSSFDALGRESKLFVGGGYGVDNYRRVESINPDGVSTVVFYNKLQKPVVVIGAPYED